MAARRTTTTRTTRETKVTSRAGADADVAEKPGTGLAEAMAIVTTLLLLAGILMTDYLLGKNYGGGVFF